MFDYAGGYTWCFSQFFPVLALCNSVLGNPQGDGEMVVWGTLQQCDLSGNPYYPYMVWFNCHIILHILHIYIYITRNEPLWFAMVVLISYKVMAPVSMVGQCRIQVWTPTVPSTTWKRPRLNEVEYLLVNVYSLLLKMAIYSGFSHKKNSDFP